ncbi:variable surface protein, partial [Plasmodium gonderi]
MGRNIYELVKQFSTCQNIIQRYDNQTNKYQNECMDLNQEISQCIKLKDEKICHKSMYYLYEIHKIIYTIGHAGCIYLYYWLYDYCNVKCSKTEIIDIYNELIQKYENINSPVCTRNENINITKDEFERLKDIYNLNIKYGINENYHEYCKEFHNIYVKRKGECDYNTHSDFCNVLEEYLNKYNKYLESENSLKPKYQILPPFKRYNIRAYIDVTL